MDNQPDVKQERPQRHRSPSYPADGLEACIEWAKKIYAAEKKAVISSAIAVKHMGYSGISSGAARVSLSSMKKFGLVSEEGAERIRLTDDAVRLVIAPDDEIRLPILRNLAQKPEIIKELLNEYGSELPSNESLKYRLVSDRGFGEAAADAFIKALRETVRVAKLDQLDNASPSEAMPRDNSQPSIQQPTTAPVDPVRRNTPAAGMQSQSIRGAVVSKQHAELSDGTQVDLQIAGPFGADVLEELLQYLELWTKVLKKRSVASSQNA